MDIVNKIDKLIGDQATAGSGATTTANVALNLAKGHVDVIGGQCPKGQKYDPKKKVCVPMKNEGVKNYDLFELGRKVQTFFSTVSKRSEKIGLTPNNSDYKEASKYLKIKKSQATKAWNYFTWGDSGTNESSVVGGSYIAGTTVNIIGSGQTRTWGVKRGDGPQRGGTRGSMIDLARKNKGEVISSDKTIENLGRKGLKFNHILGAYVPDQWGEEDNERMDRR